MFIVINLGVLPMLKASHVLMAKLVQSIDNLVNKLRTDIKLLLWQGSVCSYYLNKDNAPEGQSL